MGSIQNTNKTLLHVENLYKIYKTNVREHLALKGISFELHRKEILTIIGASGSGKTTLFNIINGSIQADAGNIVWNGQNSNQGILNSTSKIGIITQKPSLLPQFSVYDNLAFRAVFNGIQMKKTKQQIIKLLKIIGLEDRLNSPPKEFSMGEQQLISLCRAIVTDPIILLADEPTANLDHKSTEKWLNVLINLGEQKDFSTIILTHDQRLLNHSTRTLELHNGVLSGEHLSNPEVSFLEKTRQLVVDNDGRLVIPKDIFLELNWPKKFRIEIKDKKIILDPVSDQVDEE